MGGDTIITVLAAALGAIATALVTWGIATRTKSGRVATTDADQLWTQNSKLIDALTADNVGLRERAAEREEAMETLRRRLHALEVKAQKAELAESDCNERADRLQAQVNALQRAFKIDGGESTEQRIVVKGEHLEAEGPEPAEGT